VFKKDVTEEGKEGRTDGSVTISFRNFVGEGIIKTKLCSKQIAAETVVSEQLRKRKRFRVVFTLSCIALQSKAEDYQSLK
jgi:hypothetical protein